MAGEASPTDGRFRRGVYVMLIVLGLFAAGGLIAARQASRDVVSANQAVRRAEAEAAAARKQVATLIDGQRAAAARDERARMERVALLRRSEALEALLAQLLADSDDEQVAAAFRDFARAGAAMRPAPQPTPRASASPRSSPSPRPPTPSATPSPSPSTSPTERPCRVPNPLGGCLLP